MFFFARIELYIIGLFIKTLKEIQRLECTNFLCFRNQYLRAYICCSNQFDSTISSTSNIQILSTKKCSKSVFYTDGRWKLDNTHLPPALWQCVNLRSTCISTHYCDLYTIFNHFSNSLYNNVWNRKLLKGCASALAEKFLCFSLCDSFCY